MCIPYSALAGQNKYSNHEKMQTNHTHFFFILARRDGILDGIRWHISMSKP